jgi:hypothetical protein
LNLSVEAILVQAAFSVIAGLIASLATTYFSLRRFYREKHWEEKFRAYSTVIEALHDMKRDLDVSLRAAMEGRDTDTEYHKELGRKHAAGWVEIRKHADVGEFLFSPRTTKILETLLGETSGHQDSWFEHLEIQSSAVNRALPAIKLSAGADLKLSVF